MLNWDVSIGDLPDVGKVDQRCRNKEIENLR